MAPADAEPIKNLVEDEAKVRRKGNTVKLKTTKARTLDDSVTRAACVLENAENVETLQFAVGDIQSLNKATRQQERHHAHAQKSVMNMFITKTLCTACAWLMQALVTKALNIALYSLSDKDTLISLIYAALIGLVVPPLQYFSDREPEVLKPGHEGPPGKVPNVIAQSAGRMLVFLELQKKALPMTIAWANKSAVAAIIGIFPDSVLLANLIACAVLTIVVTAVQNVPAVEKAQKRLKHGENGIQLRYLAWPSSLLLSVGYVYNGVATWTVNYLVGLDASLSEGASFFLTTLLQCIYFTLIAIFITRLDAYWLRKKVELQEQRTSVLNEIEEERKENEHADLHDLAYSIHLELQNDLGDTMAKAIAFVYAWGLSNTLNDIFFMFFLNLSSYSAGTYQQSWEFALILTVALGYGTSLLSLAQYRSAESKSYKKLMITAMANTLGWAYMNVMSMTTNYVLAQLVDADGSTDGMKQAICYLLLFVIAQAFCSEIFFQIQDAVRVSHREVHDFHQAYPTELPDKFDDIDDVPSLVAAGVTRSKSAEV